MTDRLKEIIDLCKCGVYVSINEHKYVYETIEHFCVTREDILHMNDAEVLIQMIERDSIISISAYPDTPVGSYCIYHYDLDKALDEMLETLKEHRIERAKYD